MPQFAGGGGVSSYNGRTGAVTPQASDDLRPTSQFDVTLYGAKGDGTTDDTAAINSAIAALNTNGGGELFFPKMSGTYYLCSGPLTAITGNTEILGEYGSGLSCPSGLSGPTNFLTIGDYCEVEDLRFHVSGQSGAIIQINGIHCKVSHCHIGDPSAGTTITIGIGISNTECQVHNNIFDNLNGSATGGGCVQIGAAAYRCQVQTNVFNSCQPSGGDLIRVKAGALEFHITDNQSANCSSTYAVDIEAGSSDDYIVTDNAFIGGPTIFDGGTGTNKLVRDNPYRRTLLTTVTADTAITGIEGGMLGDATAGAITITLPAVGMAYPGESYLVMKVDSSANHVTVQGASGNINGSANLALTTQYEGKSFQTDGTNWFAV